VRIATILRLEPDPIGYIDFDEGKISMGSVDRRDAILCSDCGTYNRTRYCSNCGRPTR
jgi:hypothetical protein